ncbi:putative repeat protein (TIGR03843 family) [Actinoalloteichus hoggarensis]|uniref:Phosphatidylinositol 3-and 4-kinase n=1 Tax=Actinoalloteichus hoggarensis TaxID=1470176 RepID=A0A221W3A6_9PSEU|nr:SCO1664 family protein [Actinoalloteichus hoggarensis]ASO20278.1 Phosphatidylinositol 3- and 4-kinase [Actinoalloteichus hoggarensis]MBB5919008.1 putative repeat protein (TIGR03843 family) [Actinoalloteichus hoggarensis]
MSVQPDDPAALEFLRRGGIEIEGRLVAASNATLFCSIELDGVEGHCVYKPVRGEQPLWDFPDGTLAGREVATYLISAAAGWDLVPPTVLRSGPFGPGMVQLWIDTDTDSELVDVVGVDDVPTGWRPVLHAHDRAGEPAVLVHADHPRLRTMAVLDAVVNNADRKGGHVLSTAEGAVYAVDHGICLNAEDKLRTVLWGWIGESLGDETRETLGSLRARLAGSLGDALHDHLTRKEVEAFGLRLDRLASAGVYPAPSDDWPAIPWPAF